MTNPKIISRAQINVTMPRQRRLIQPAFNHSRLTGYAENMATEINKVTASWCDGQVLDLSAEMVALTIRLFTGAVFPGTLPPSALNQAIADLSTLVAGMYRRMITPSLIKKLPTPQGSVKFRACVEGWCQSPRSVETIYAASPSARVARYSRS